MSRRRIQTIILGVLLLMMLLPNQMKAEERPIYIGDLIELDIASNLYTMDEIEEAFSEFDIVTIDETKDGYQISFRSFQVGEQIVKLGNQEITINVQSTLTEDSSDIIESDLLPEKGPFMINWPIIFYIVLGIDILSGLFIFIAFLKKKRTKPETVYGRFIRQINTLALENNSYLVLMTTYLKGYIEGSYGCLIRGKTSTEIAKEISGIVALKPMVSEVESWLKSCDTYKFSQGNQTTEAKISLKEKVKLLVEKIEKSKGVE
jgi:hypothetical protein